MSGTLWRTCPIKGNAYDSNCQRGFGRFIKKHLKYEDHECLKAKSTFKMEHGATFNSAQLLSGGVLLHSAFCLFFNSEAVRDSARSTSYSHRNCKWKNYKSHFPLQQKDSLFSMEHKPGDFTAFIVHSHQIQHTATQKKSLYRPPHSRELYTIKPV